MESTKLHDWLQIVGLFGVILSLIFVGVQLKQTQDIALATTYNERAAISVSFIGSRIDPPALNRAMVKMYSGLRDELSAEEWVNLESYFSSALFLLENSHYQYEMGFLPEEHWQYNLSYIDCFASEPVFREMARFARGRESFMEIVRSAMAQGERANANCWADWGEEPPKYFKLLDASGVGRLHGESVH